MRTSIFVLALVVARGAAAEPRCFSGTATSDDGKPHTHRLVLVREADPGKREIRERSWRELIPTERTKVIRVDPAHHGYEYELHDMKVTGTFDGDPWSWTAFAERSSGHGMTMITEGKLVGDMFVAIQRITGGDLPETKTRVEAKAFDCKELDRRRAELDETAPGAKHFCYDGSEKTILAETEHVVIEQIVEPKRIRIIRHGPKSTAVHVLAIVGNQIEVRSPLRSALHGVGTLTGTPGAWTGFAYKTDGSLSLAVTSSLGGDKLTETVTPSDARIHPGTVTATAFDCKDLAKRAP